MVAFTSFRRLMFSTFCGIAATACVSEKPVCPEGQTVCDGVCVEVAYDSRNCSACGNECAAGEACQAAECMCRKGHSLCDDLCVDIQVSVAHCGACGNACAEGLFCEEGLCVASCQKGAACGFSCVSLTENERHCGACDNACGTAQSCHDGRCTFDAVAACLTNGQLVGIQAESHFRSSAVSVGQGPAALTRWRDDLLVLDGLDRRLYSVELFSKPLSVNAKFARTGDVPNQAVVTGEYVLVANAGSGTLQVLSQEDEGFTTVAELNFGSNTYPEGVALLGNRAFVPLYGGVGRAAAEMGQKVLELDVSDFRSMRVVREFDLKTLDLEPFEGKTPVPRPFAIVAHRGAVYVALNNLNADSYEVEGPGLLARIQPSTGEMTKVSLGGRTCLNPIWLTSWGEYLLVSCQGKVTYSGPPNYEAVSVEGAGVALLDESETLVSFWSAPPKVLPSRMGVGDSQVYVGDQNSGRVFALRIENEVLLEESEISVCAVNSTTGVSNVADVWVRP